MDFFIMESSVSGIVGNATQAAYAAGNTFLDSFASYRNARGLPATTIDLGAISDVGYLAKNPELKSAMQRQGFELTDKKTLMSLIHFAIKNPRRSGLLSQIVSGLGVWEEGSSLDSLNLPLFAHFRSGTSRSSRDAKGAGSAGQLRKSLRTAKSLENASELICAALVDKIASRAGVGVEHINIGNPVSDYGIDSLVAVEIRNWVSKEMGATIPILELLANMPLSQLAMKISQRSRLVQLNEAETP
jgi:acyl carrier protein